MMIPFSWVALDQIYEFKCNKLFPAFFWVEYIKKDFQSVSKTSEAAIGGATT